jgi:quercetin dioxygenase-like cupin family protein
VKRLVVAMCVLALACVSCTSGSGSSDQQVGNLLAQAPYRDGGMGKRKLVDQKHLLMMQAALKPGQMVPQHNANSNVHIIVLDGQVVINLAGKDIVASRGQLVPVACKTPMNIKNKSQAPATFVIIKTPHPGQMGK